MTNRVILANILFSVFSYVAISFGMQNVPVVKGSLVKILVNPVVAKTFIGEAKAVTALPEEFAQVYLPLVNKEDWNGYEGHLQISADTSLYSQSHLKFPSGLLQTTKEVAVIESMLLLQQNPLRANIQSLDGTSVIDLEGFSADNFAFILKKFNCEKRIYPTGVQALNTMHVVVKLAPELDQQQCQIHQIKSCTLMIPTPEKKQVAGIDKGFEITQIDLEEGRSTFWGKQLSSDAIYVHQMGDWFSVAPDILNQIKGLLQKKDQFVISFTNECDGTIITMCIARVSSGSYFYSLNKSDNMTTMDVVINSKKMVDQKSWLSPVNFARFVGLLIIMGITFRAYQSSFSGDAFFG